ncbi:MAG: FHA domain-containing protein [Myxococcota bacterium]
MKDTTRIQSFDPTVGGEPRYPCVEVLSGKRSGERIVLEPGRNEIGRDASIEVTLDDSGVSRRHAEVAVDERGHAVLTDLESTNGTYVNGARTKSAALHEGDQIFIGSGEVELRFGYRTKIEIAQRVPPSQLPVLPTAEERAAPSPLTKR